MGSSNRLADVLELGKMSCVRRMRDWMKLRCCQIYKNPMTLCTAPTALPRASRIRLLGGQLACFSLSLSLRRNRKIRKGTCTQQPFAQVPPSRRLLGKSTDILASEEYVHEIKLNRAVIRFHLNLDDLFCQG